MNNARPFHGVPFIENSAQYTSHFLLSHITIFEAMTCSEKGVNAVAMTNINRWKEIDQVKDQTNDLLFFNFCTTDSGKRVLLLKACWQGILNALLFI